MLVTGDYDPKVVGSNPGHVYMPTLSIKKLMISITPAQTVKENSFNKQLLFLQATMCLQAFLEHKMFESAALINGVHC